MIIRKRGKQIKGEQGFTLLEILVALTIVGMVTGTLFSLLGGSKRLAGRGKGAIARTMAVRMLIYEVSLNRTKEVRSMLPDDFSFTIDDVPLTPPHRKTKPMHNVLQKEILHVAGMEIPLVRFHYSPSPR